MKPTVATAPWEKLLAPRALFAGVAVAFISSCVAGHLASRHNYLPHFERFHRLLSPESLYYPTARQVRALGRAQLDPNKIVVVVGGSSIMHGTCQRVDHVWTKRLQALLGDDYQVINFAMRSGQTTEFGEYAAEILESDHPRLIFVTDTHPCALPDNPEGNFYKYFFWDAYCKHLIDHDAERDGRIADAERVERANEAKSAVGPKGPFAPPQRELPMEMTLDRPLAFNDLWNAVAYTRLHTMWTAVTRGRFLHPRAKFHDDDAGALPLAIRYTVRGDNDWTLALVKTKMIGCIKDNSGQWIEDDKSGVWQDLERRAAYNFPAKTRRRTLMLSMWFSSYYINQLSPDERAKSIECSRATVRHLGNSGLCCLEIGEHYLPADYGDWQHLTEDGGTKMATEVAPAIRALAGRLGYTQGVK